MKRFDCFRHSRAKLNNASVGGVFREDDHDDEDFGSGGLGVGFDGVRIQHREREQQQRKQTGRDARDRSPAATVAPITAPASPAAATQFKAGDKVKVTINGTASDATVVSVDEKAGKATVKIQGQKEDKTVALSAVSKR